MTELITVVRENHEENKRIRSALREDVLKIRKTFVNALKNFQYSNPSNRKRGGASDVKKSAMAIFEVVKYLNFVELLNNTKGTPIFVADLLVPRLISLLYFRRVACYTGQSNLNCPIENFLNEIDLIGSINSLVPNYLDRSPGCVHDSILNRFINAFVSVFYSTKPLSLSSPFELSSKTD